MRITHYRGGELNVVDYKTLDSNGNYKLATAPAKYTQSSIGLAF